MTCRQVSVVGGSRVPIRMFVLLNVRILLTGVTTKWISENLWLTKKTDNSPWCLYECFKEQSLNICNKVLRWCRRLQGCSVKTSYNKPGTIEYFDRQQGQLGPYLERQQRKVSQRHCYKWRREKSRNFHWSCVFKC